jgi:hypothetical protein
MSILQKRSLDAGTLPTTASLLVGEIVINVPDGRIFLRKSGSTDTIQSAITTGAQNSGSVVLSGSLALYSTSGSVLSVASDTLEFNGDQMEFTGSYLVSGSMTLTGSFFVASDTLEFNGDQMEFTGSFITSGSVRVIGPSTFTGSLNLTGSIILTGSSYGNVPTITVASNTASFDIRSGNFFTLTMGASSTTHFNVTNPSPGQTVSILVRTNTASTASFSSNVRQVTGSLYTPSVSGSNDILTFVTFDSTNVFMTSLKRLA